MANQDDPAKKDDKLVSESNMEMGSMSQIRTLVAINQRKNLEATLTHLERNYYQLHIVNRIPDLIRGLQIHRPQVVLLSWNLKNTDVKKVYRLLTQKFHLICIVFAEDMGTRTTASLMSSGIPNSLLAPVSGPSMQMRIQSLLTPRLRPRKRAAVAPIEMSRKTNIIDKSKVPPNMEWKEIPEKKGEKMWRGVRSPLEKEDLGVFFFKGPAAPIYDKAKKEWNTGKDPAKGGIFMQERTPTGPDHSAVQEGIAPGQEYSAIQEGIEGKEYNITTKAASAEMLEATEEGATPLDKDFDWDAALKEAENEISDAVQEVPVLESAPNIIPPNVNSPNIIPINQKEKDKEKKNTKPKNEADIKDSELGNIIAITYDIHSRNPQAGESVLAKCLRSALTRHPGPPQAETDEKTPVSKMTVCTLNSERFCGYVVCVSIDNKFQKDFMTEIMKVLGEEMKNVGEPLSGSPNILEFEIGAVPFGPWAESKADFTIVARETGISLAFFSTENQPQVIEAQDESVLGISLEKDIVGDIAVLFNVYIHLPKNDKYLLYLNNGQIFTTNSLTKFISYGVRTVYIRKTEKEFFLAYCARNFINSSLK